RSGFPFAVHPLQDAMALAAGCVDASSRRTSSSKSASSTKPYTRSSFSNNSADARLLFSISKTTHTARMASHGSLLLMISATRRSIAARCSALTSHGRPAVSRASWRTASASKVGLARSGIEQAPLAPAALPGAAFLNDLQGVGTSFGVEQLRIVL